MKNICLSFMLLVFSYNAFSQTFVTVDNDTYELVEDVNYSLYSNKKNVFNGITLADKATEIKEDVVYDSITFSRVDYETIGFSKPAINSAVYLTKKIIYLDEVVIGTDSKKEVVLGETNRFVKRQSKPFQKELIYGSVFLNSSPQKLQLDKMSIYVDKVRFKTAYKINFTEVNEIIGDEAHVFAEPGDVIFSTDTLYLNPKDKGRVEVVLPDGFYLPATKKMFVWVQLLGYYDETGVIITPEDDKRTKLKFQLSEKACLYSKTSDYHTKKLSKELININKWLNYDYAFQFFDTPHKSDLVAPALVIYAHKVESKPLGKQ